MWTTYWPSWIAPAGGEHGDDVGQHVVGDGQQEQVAGAGDGRGLLDGYAGQQGGDPAAGGVGLTGGGDDLVAGGAQGGGQDGADAAGADDADAQDRVAGQARSNCSWSTSRCSPSAIRPLRVQGADRYGYQTIARCFLVNNEASRPASRWEPNPDVVWVTPGRASGVWEDARHGAPPSRRRAAGRGHRGADGDDLPKQLLEVGGRTLLEHALRTFHRHPEVDAITVVMAAGHLDAARSIVAAGGYADKVTHVVEGGATRSDSTVAGARDAGRRPVPGAGPRRGPPAGHGADHHRLLRVARVVPGRERGHRVADTIVEVDADGLVRATLDRASLRRVQTPQGFHSEVLREAHALAAADPDFAATDDCGVVMRYLPDRPVVVVAGDERNLKVTTPADLQVVAALLAADDA